MGKGCGLLMWWGEVTKFGSVSFGEWFCWLLWLFSDFYVETSLVENVLGGWFENVPLYEFWIWKAEALKW